MFYLLSIFIWIVNHYNKFFIKNENSSKFRSPSPSASIYSIIYLATSSDIFLSPNDKTLLISSLVIIPLPSSSNVLKTTAIFSLVNNTFSGIQATINSLYSIYPEPEASIIANILSISSFSIAFPKYF